MTIEEVQAELEQLKAANKTLAAENKRLAKLQNPEISREQFDALQEKFDAASAELSQTKPALKKITDQYDEAIKRIETLQTHAKTAALENTITSQLAAAKVRPELMDAAKALFMQKAQVAEADGKYSVTLDGKPADVAFGEWSKSDAAAAFIAAPANGGGSAGGGGTGSGAATKPFNEMSEQERVNLYMQNPDTYRQAVASSKVH